MWVMPMPSLTEISISVNNHYDAIKIVVLDVVAAQSIYPRLVFNVEYTLSETDKTGYPLKDYELIDLCGELRLSEQTETIGTFEWIGQRHQTKSGTKPQGHRINLHCDLDPRRIEAIEKHRDGKPPTFFIELWPTLAGKDYFTNIQTRPTRITIDRDKWVKILSGLRYGNFDVIEIPRGEMDFEGFEKTIRYLKESHKRLNLGDYDDCLSKCRMAIESMQKLMPKREDTSDSHFKKYLEEKLGEESAKEYTGIISRVKQLMQSSVHDFGDDIDVKRAQVRFLMRSTENILYLLGSLGAGKAVME